MTCRIGGSGICNDSICCLTSPRNPVAIKLRSRSVLKSEKKKKAETDHANLILSARTTAVSEERN